MSVATIPNTLPWITEQDIDAVVRCLRSGRIGSSEATLAPAIDVLREHTDGKRALLTTSCTTAMELALSAYDLTFTDRVVVPSYTFVSTANAVLLAGGRPLFIDIDEETLNIDLDAFEALSHADNIRGVMPVHYAGISCDMDRLLACANVNRLFVIEDAAHAVGARYKGRALGSLGDFGCFSFHDTKNYVAGEGGALVMNQPDREGIIERMYEKGTNRSQFLRGEVDKYTWVSRGSSYTVSAILATLLQSQLLRFEEIRSARAAIIRRYREGLSGLVSAGHIRFTSIPDYATPNHHLAFFLVRDVSRRDALLTHLKERGVGALFHYVPLHLSPFAKQYLGTKEGQYPVTEKVAASIVRLPLYPTLSPANCDSIIDHVTSFFQPSHGARSATVSFATTATAHTPPHIDLTLVIACYNEAPHLIASLSAIVRTLDQMHIVYEIMIIDDCSHDETRERIREFLTIYSHHRIHAIFHEKNCGRGATVSEGFRMASGRFVGFIDIDLEIDAVYIPAALLPLRQGQADAVLADRYYRFHRSALVRYVMSKGYRWLVETLLGTPHFDTEAGFKFFRRAAILPILDAIVDTHWFWDTEIIIRSFDAGLKIHSEPVLFDRKQHKISTVKAWSDSWRSLSALLRFRRCRRAYR